MRYLLLVLHLLGPLCIPRLAGQADLPVTVSVFKESTSMPFTNWWSDPVHPGVQVGTALCGNSERRFQVYPAINIGYLFHRNLFQGLYANMDLGVEYWYPSGISVKTKIGAGYLRTFTTRTEYRPENGQLVPKRDRGNHRVMPSLTLGLGYRLRPGNPRSTEIFLLHQTWLEYPYAGDFIPLMAHTNVHLGTTFYLFAAKKHAR